MRRPTISEFYNTIDEMRKAYPFEDYKTCIRTTNDLIQNGESGIELWTIDEVSQTEVTLVRQYAYDKDTDERMMF